MEIGEETHRRLAVDLFNHAWLLLRRERSSEHDLDLIHEAHASRHHWARAGGTPAHLARGEWLCSRVYSTLGRGEPALFHARRCLELNELGGPGFEDWDLASARQGMAHALLADGQIEEATRFVALSRVAVESIADAEDRAVIERQLNELGELGG